MANNIIRRTWKRGGMVNIEDLHGSAFQAEDGGHTFLISGVDENGDALALSGTPAGVLLRADGQDVTLTCSVSDGVVSATLPANAYVVPGRVGITIFLTSDGQKTAIYAAVGSVAITSSGIVAPPAGSDVVDLVNAIATAVATIPASYTDLMAAVAPTYSTSALYAVGSYAWYDGKLYRCTTAITSGETWTSAHWTLANLGSDVSDLKSAIRNENGNVDYEYESVESTDSWADGAFSNAIVGETLGFTSTTSWKHRYYPVTAGKFYHAKLYATQSTTNIYGVFTNNSLTVIAIAYKGAASAGLQDFDDILVPYGATRFYIITYSGNQSSSGVIYKNFHTLQNQIHTLGAYAEDVDARKVENRFNEFSNYFDEKKIQRNKSINSGTGAIVSYSDWWLSDKIVMDFTKKIIISGMNNQAWAYCYTHDTSISGYGTGYYGRIKCEDGVVIANTYPNTEYIRLTGSDANGFHAVVEYGDTASGYTEFNPSDYIPKVITDNKEAEATMTAISYSDTKQTGQTLYRNHYLTLLHLSDTHGNGLGVRDAVEYANRFKNIDAVLHTGDAQKKNYFENETEHGFADTVKPYFLKSWKPCLYVIGNHDCGNHFVAPCSDQDVYDYYIKDIKDQMGVTIEANKSYYFKDFTNQKIRLIVLNEYDNPRTMNGDAYLFDQWNRFFSQDQVTWLCGVLSSTTQNPTTGLPDDYSVVIALHQWVYDLDIDTLNSCFTYPKGKIGWKANVGFYKSNQDNTLLRNIVDAFISKTTLSKTYDVDSETYSYLPTGTYAVTVDADFSDRTNSNFICFLSGHAHMDTVGYVKGMTNRAINIVITTNAMPETMDTDCDDLPRIGGTKSENAFNIVSFDTDTKNIKLCRIGADMTYDLMERKYTKVSYDFSGQ